MHNILQSTGAVFIILIRCITAELKGERIGNLYSNPAFALRGSKSAIKCTKSQYLSLTHCDEFIVCRNFGKTL